RRIAGPPDTRRPGPRASVDGEGRPAALLPRRLGDRGPPLHGAGLVRDRDRRPGAGRGGPEPHLAPCRPGVVHPPDAERPAADADAANAGPHRPALTGPAPRRSVHVVEQVPQLVFLRLEVTAVLLVGRDLDGDPLDDAQVVAVQADHLLGVVG